MSLKTDRDSEPEQQSAAPCPSRRYNRLVECLEHSLAASKRQFDTEEAIREVYGEDAKLFDDGSSENNNFLASAIDAMVDQVNNRVMKEMLEFFEKEKMKEHLDKIESIEIELDKEDEDAKRREAEDRQSARDALEAVRLPPDVTPEDVIRYQSYQLMLKEKQSLLEALAKVESDTKELDDRILLCGGEVEKGEKSLQKVAQDLKETAAMLKDSTNTEASRTDDAVKKPAKRSVAALKTDD